MLQCGLKHETFVWVKLFHAVYGASGKIFSQCVVSVCVSQSFNSQFGQVRWSSYFYCTFRSCGCLLIFMLLLILALRLKYS